MATVTKPIALDESLNTTEVPSRNVADVLAEELQNIAQAIGGSGGDSVQWTQIQSTGTKIAEIEINGTSTNVYAPNGGGGGGGHTIEGADGTALSQEPTLQFADADAADDAVNEKTVVNVVRKRTQAQYDAMSAADKAKGVIEITDADAKPLDASQVRYGAGTVEDALDESVASGTITRVFIGAGYTTASGNYFACILPLKTKQGASVSLSAIGNNWAYTGSTKIDNPFQLANSSIPDVYSDYVVINFRFVSTQTPERMMCARVEVTLTIS